MGITDAKCLNAFESGPGDGTAVPRGFNLGNSGFSPSPILAIDIYLKWGFGNSRQHIFTFRHTTEPTRLVLIQEYSSSGPGGPLFRMRYKRASDSSSDVNILLHPEFPTGTPILHGNGVIENATWYYHRIVVDLANEEIHLYTAPADQLGTLIFPGGYGKNSVSVLDPAIRGFGADPGLMDIMYGRAGGNDPPRQIFRGRVSELRIWNTILPDQTVEDISDIFIAGSQFSSQLDFNMRNNESSPETVMADNSTSAVNLVAPITPIVEAWGFDDHPFATGGGTGTTEAIEIPAHLRVLSVKAISIPAHMRVFRQDASTEIPVHMVVGVKSEAFTEIPVHMEVKDPAKLVEIPVHLDVKIAGKSVEIPVNLDVGLSKTVEIPAHMRVLRTTENTVPTRLRVKLLAVSVEIPVILNVEGQATTSQMIEIPAHMRVKQLAKALTIPVHLRVGPKQDSVAVPVHLSVKRTTELQVAVHLSVKSTPATTIPVHIRVAGQQETKSATIPVHMSVENVSAMLADLDRKIAVIHRRG